MSSVVFQPRAAQGDARAECHRDVVLIGYQDQGNLGMGYLAAALKARAFTIDLLEIRDDRDALIERVRTAQPAVVGFSLIFQYFLPDYAKLARLLRDAGVTSHFTIGGHFASLCPDEALAAIPQLDSVVMFEGEDTICEIVSCLRSGSDWQRVPGVAMRGQGSLVETETRPLIEDLDSLPFPVRNQKPGHVLGWPYDPVLASRGCARRCSFCSIHVFYRTAPGKVVRMRRPERIVDEIRELYEHRRVSIVLFQDDDFPLWGRAGKRWVTELTERLHDAGLVGRVIWKISCRAEYVEHELFEMLRDAGLYLVYMGLESGDEGGLEVLNKRISRGTNLEAVKTLKDIGIPFAYGFMMFDPSTSFDSIRENVGFLREIVGDGSAAAVFCRMLPYGGTPIREQLRSEGRLRGDVTNPDYAFLDPRMDRLHARLDASAGGWIHGGGVSHQLDWAWHEVQVVERLVPTVTGLDGYRERLRDLTAESNRLLLDHVLDVAAGFEAGNEQAGPVEESRLVQERLITDLLAIRNDFVLRNQDTMFGALRVRRSEPAAPVMLPQIH